MLEPNQINLALEISDSKLKSLYNTHKGSCSIHYIKKGQCDANPNCLRDFLDSTNPFSNLFSSGGISTDKKDADFLRGKNIKYSGLQNLGVTCYMNSILQTFFSIPTFRNYIYDWKQKEDENIQVEGEKKGDTNQAMYQLQLLFANLEKGFQKFIKPDDLASHLELNLSYQQDAEEFYQLLLSFIEEKLKEVGKEEAVKSHFVGEQIFETKCEACDKKTQKSESFNKIGLNIENNYTFSSMMRQFLSEEKVEGYVCEGCKASDKCVRSLKLVTLPPFLSFQLLRFVFDRATGQRKKLFDDVNISTKINMRDYLPYNTNQETQYIVHAVIVHLGSSSHAGHYICYLFDADQGCWWKLDDSEVTRVNEWDQPFQKNYSDFQQTNTPYFIVYRRIDFKTSGIPSSIPVHFEQEVDAISQKLSMEHAINSSLKESQERDKLKNKELREKFITELKYPNSYGNYYWIDTHWLEECIKKFPDQEIPPLDNTKILCPHKNISLDTLKMKRIPSKCWDMVINKYHGGPALTDENMCRECAVEKIEAIRLERIHTEKKEMIIKLADPPSRLYSPSSHVVEKYCINKPWYFSWKKGSFTDTDFVKDLTCRHGNFSLPVPDNELFVVEEAFEYFKNEYMSNAEVPRYEKNQPRCRECQEEFETTKQVRDAITKEREQEKLDLKYLNPAIYFYDKSKYPIISAAWYKEWENYITDTSIDKPPCQINEDLICSHGKLSVDIIMELYKEKSQRCIIALKEFDDWKKFLKYYPGSHEIIMNVTKYISYVPEIEGKSDPLPCQECIEHNDKIKMEKEKVFMDTEFTVIKSGYLGSKINYYVTASHTNTINQFKMLVCAATDINPYQQELLIDGTHTSLDNDEATLADYNVTPHTKFYVRALSENEALDKMMVIDETPVPSKHTEVGFDGSILLKQNKIISPREQKEPIDSKQDVALSNSDNIIIESPPTFSITDQLYEFPRNNPISNSNVMDQEFSNEHKLISNQENFIQSDPTLVWPCCSYCTFENTTQYNIESRLCEVCDKPAPVKEY